MVDVGTSLAARGITFPASSFASAAAIEAMLAANDAVIVPPTVIEIDRTINVPAGKRLVAQQEGVSGFCLATASTSRHVVKLASYASAEGLILDGNLTARESAGTLTDYCWGAVISDASFATIKNVHCVDLGCTEADYDLNAGNGGGVLVEITSAATSNMIGNVVDGVYGDLPKAGFHCRLWSPFKAPYNAHGSLVDPAGVPIFLTKNIVRNVRGVAGRKNAIELCGPAVSGNVVQDCEFVDLKGQAGIEADFGANLNRFERCKLHFSTGFLLERSFYGFNQVRSNSSDGARSFGNTFVDCDLEFFGQLTGGNHLSAIMETGMGSDAKFINMTMRGPYLSQAFRKEGGATGIVSFYLNQTNYGAGRNTYIENPLALNVDRAIKVIASQAIDRITVNGGHLHSRGAIFEHAGGGVLTDMLFTGACKLQTAGTTVTTGAGTTTNIIYDDRVLGPQMSITNPTA